MTRRVKIHRLRQSIYPVKMAVVICDDLDAAHRSVFPGEKCDLSGYGAVMIPRGKHYFILIKPDASESTVAHESFHMTVDVMEWCGFKVTKNHEPAAYLCGWIAGKVHKAILKHRLSPH